MNANQIERPIGFSPHEISSLINEEIVYQHAEEAAFLWTLRNSATFEPNFKLKDLADLDERVEANIDGLRVAGETGWEYSKMLLDQDKDLPYPDSNLIQRWWDKHKQQFTTGQRYLMGKKINDKSLNTVLLQGNQRQCAAAAIELVLLKPGMPLFETRAPAKRQQILLESWTS